MILVCVLLLILAAALIFLKTWPAFGGQASKADMEDYERRADHYSGGKFSNSEPFEMMTDHMEEDDKILSHKGVKPEDTISHKAAGTGKWGGTGYLVWTFFLTASDRRQKYPDRPSIRSAGFPRILCRRQTVQSASPFSERTAKVGSGCFVPRPL